MQIARPQTPMGHLWNSIQSLGEVPSEATFSRAFEAFARDGRPQQIHEATIKAHYGEKIARHISRDATAIHAREKAEAKPTSPPKPKRGKLERRGKDDPPVSPPDPTRLQRQLERDLKANLADLPTVCDWGCKKNSQSNSHLHEEHGGRHVRVRGPVKVAAHLAFGLVVIAAEQLLRMLK